MAEPVDITIRMYTNRFLGTVDKGRELLRLLETIDSGRWVPEKWNAFEPIRHAYGVDASGRILKMWSEARPAGGCQVINELLFRRRRPRMLLDAQAWRSSRGRLNSLWGDFEAKAFLDDKAPERIRQMVLEIVSWSDAIHVTAFHTHQLHGRAVPGTPLECLRCLNWLTYWGAPYVEMIGRERLLRTPCYRVEEFGTGVLMQAAPRFDSPELVESDRLLIRLEQYIGPDLFVGPDYPNVPCRVPPIDMSETVCDIPPPRMPKAAPPKAADAAQLAALVAELTTEAETAAARKGIALDYSPQSIALIDTLLDQFRSEWIGRRDAAVKKVKRRLASAFGAYIGELLRRARGGHWEYEEAEVSGVVSIALQLGESRAYPADKAYKRLTRGPSEGLTLYAAALLKPGPSTSPDG